MDKYLKHANWVMETIADHRKPKTVIGCEIITDSMPTISSEHASGWGEKAVSTTIVGEPMRFTFIRDGEPTFSVRMLEDGRLVITNYKGTFEFSPGHQVTLESK